MDDEYKVEFLVQPSGRHCSSCNGKELGRPTKKNGKWKFIVEEVAHDVTCQNLDAPLYDYLDWDTVALYGSIPNIPRPIGPYREGARACKSGSIASGGKRSYCTCDICW